MPQDRGRRLALTLKGAFAELGVVSVCRRDGDGCKSGEGGALELCREELATGGEELVDAREEVGVLGRPSGEGRERHVHAFGNFGKRALLEE